MSNPFNTWTVAASLSGRAIDHGREYGSLDGDADEKEEPEEEAVDRLSHTEPLGLYPGIVHLPECLRRVPMLERVVIVEYLQLDVVHAVPVVSGFYVRQRASRLEHEARPVDERGEPDDPARARLVRVALAVDVRHDDGHEQRQRDHQHCGAEEHS